MIYYFLMVLGIFCGAGNSITLRHRGLKVQSSVSGMFAFNSGMMLAWMLVLSLWMLLEPGTEFSWLVLAFGAAYGLILGSMQFVKTAAMSLGPVAVTTLLGSMAFVVPIFFDLFAYGIIPDAFQILGMVLIVIALILIVNPRRSGGEFSLKWGVYTLGYFIVGGFIGIFYRVFGKSAVSDQITPMMFTASIFGALAFFLGSRVRKSPVEPPVFTGSGIVYMLLAGGLNCVYMRMNFITSQHIPSAIFFPAVNGSIVILTTLAGRFLFREKLKPAQLLGILVALLGLVVNGGGKAIWELMK